MPTESKLGQSPLSHVVAERNSQKVLIAFVLSGLFFLLLPGTFLGFWNLLRISEQHDVRDLPQAWLQAHGQAQLFGWVGSFILGIGLYAAPRKSEVASNGPFLSWTIWILWTIGNTLRWLTGINSWHWHAILITSGCLEVLGLLLFLAAMRSHRSRGVGLALWTRLVVGATAGFAIAVCLNLGITLYTSLTQSSPEVPHVLSQQFNLTVVWAAMVPMIWGFNARWLPSFLGISKPHGSIMAIAYAGLLLGVGLLWSPLWESAAFAFLVSILLSVEGLQISSPSSRGITLPHLYAGFAWWVRAAYAWALVSCVLSVVANSLDTVGGYWGASRHAITVGFIGTMVFAIAQRILPAFCGMRILWSRNLMIASLAFLNLGCFLRVIAEPLAYEGIASVGWKVLPVSATLELIAVACFVCNLVVTLIRRPAHVLRSDRHSPLSVECASL
jgi:hypothetical protein